MGIFHNFRGENKKYLKSPPSNPGGFPGILGLSLEKLTRSQKKKYLDFN